MFSVSAPGKNSQTKETKNVLREKISGVYLTVFLVWSLGINQMMQLILILVMLVLTETGGTTEEGEEESSLPVWRVSQDESLLPPPHFTAVHQLVQVQPDQTALLECAVANVDTSVTVSWLRWADMSVLSVGGFVFSSDPRMRVSVTRISPSAVSWSLHIAQVQPGDSGDYQCQINTEPKQSLDVTLSVVGQSLSLSPLYN